MLRGNKDSHLQFTLDSPCTGSFGKIMHWPEHVYNVYTGLTEINVPKFRLIDD